MNTARILYHLVKADFLERVRRYSFLLTLGFACYLAYAAGTGQIVLRLDTYQGVLNSAWCGSMMTLVSTTFLSLVGFYIVKNSLLRDELTRVGQILASTPMTRSLYCLGKALSNFVVLSATLGILAAGAVLLQVLRRGHFPIEPITLVSPFIWVGLPCMAFIAAVAVLFETIPFLRGGIGNVIYFFAWGAGLGYGIEHRIDDLAGVNLIARNMQDVLRTIDPTYKTDMSLTIANNVSITKSFVWNGVDWTAPIVLHRLIWVMAAIAVALLASLFFHRFDPARELRWKRPAQPSPLLNGFGGATPDATPVATVATHLTPLRRSEGQHRFGQLVASELRLMLKGQRWWWRVVAAGLLFAQFVTPSAEGRMAILVAAWLWPILIWSQMGAREARYETYSLLLSSEGALYRQLPAVWTAGLLLALLSGAGTGLRLLLAANLNGFYGFLAGAIFIPSLALSLGVWSGSGKAFEAMYTVWWYLGPLHHTPGLDFIGTTPQSSSPARFVVYAVLLMAAAYLGRRRRLGYV